MTEIKIISPCYVCENAVSFKGSEVICKQFGPSDINREHCAAQILTPKGWEMAALKAKEKGLLSKMRSCYERAIELSNKKL